VIAGILGTEAEFISIKATTHEQTDAAGRGESMVAYATVLVVRES
jgi:2C-methyl-D-erythritol 2,4-cyclodiphosphate synthase